MGRFKWLLPLLLLGLVPSAKAVNRPYWTTRCGTPRAGFNVVSSATCTIPNVVSGQTVLLDASGAANTITITISTGETLTCVTAGVNGTDWVLTKCRFVATSNHASIVVTSTASGGFNRTYWIGARAYNGLGAFDTSCNSVTASCSLTTANNGEWIDLSGVADADDITPGTGFQQRQYGNAENGDISAAGIRTANWFEVAGTAGSYTASLVAVADAAHPTVIAFAFQVSSPPPLPSVVILQTCVMAWPDSTRSSDLCALHNYLANNQINLGFGVINTQSASGAGTNITCPASSQTGTTYGGFQFGTGVCTGSDTVNHATYEVGISVAFGAGQSVSFVEAAEVSGLTTLDTGSEAAANALTVNYTTAATNESTWTMCQDKFLNPLLSASATAIQVGGSNDQDGGAGPQQVAFFQDTTVASGSNTTACSMTGTVRPLIGTLSFGVAASAATVKHKASIL
jgi:hypothetical protein